MYNFDPTSKIAVTAEERALGLIYRLDTMIVELDKAITDYEKKVKCVLTELYVG